MARTVRGRVTLAGPAVVLLAALVTGLIAWLRHAPDDRVPYHDAAVSGSIGLCDRNGHEVSSGSTTGAPFAWRAVGTTAAVGDYARTGRSATLYVFQPRAGVEPQLWSGRLLTAAGEYTNPAHPMAAATDADVALHDFLAGYPAIDHGFVQLRLYLSAPGLPTQTARYDALDIKVSGHTWRAVGGAPVNCAAGNSVSFETVVQPSGAARQ